jgi:aminoglycoside phosphotransferase (APT) family kinase protein
LGEAAVRNRFCRFLADMAEARTVELEDLRLLPGGAVQENWLVVTTVTGGPLAGRQRLVLRTNAPTSLVIGHGRAEEFALLHAARAAGVTVPEPLFLCRDTGIIGKPFFLMRWIPGTAIGERVVAGEAGGDRQALAERLGRELATLHVVRPPRTDLAFLHAPPGDAAQGRLREFSCFFVAHDESHPVAEWGLRWLLRHAPPPIAPVLCHGDFRTGNYLVDERGLTALLDWEFAHWGDPYEDIAWFCLACWRFGARERGAGGIAPRTAFYHGYEAVSGHRVDPARVRYWEVMAALRWLVIALQQRDRFLVRGERSLDLALTGRRPAECELEILLLTEGEGKTTYA